MNTSTKNRYDSIERLIFEDGIKIKKIDFQRDIDMMLIFLNTSAVLHQKISDYPSLHHAEDRSLNKIEIIADGTGVFWPDLDFYLALKGFLKDELRSVVGVSEHQ